MLPNAARAYPHFMRVVYERARRRNPERWARHTRPWSRRGTVILNPEAHHAVANTIDLQRDSSARQLP